MLDDVGKSQADDPISDISAGPVEAIGIVEVVAPLGGRSLIHDLPESLAVPWDRRIEPGIGLGFDVDERSKGAGGCTVHSLGTFIEVFDVWGSSISVSDSLDGTCVDMNPFVFIVLMMPHSEALRAQGSPVRVELDSSIVKKMWKGFLAAF
jgi:hypothetical protein